MDFDYSKLLYVSIEKQDINRNNIFVAMNYYSTVFFLLNNNLYNLNLLEMDKYIEHFNILIVYCFNIKHYKHLNKIISFDKLTKYHINHDLIYNNYDYSLYLQQQINDPIIIILYLDLNTNIKYILNICSIFINKFIIITYTDDIKDEILKTLFNINNIYYIKINKKNHMAGFLAGLNHINNYKHDYTNYTYIFKLYYHENMLVNNSFLNLNLKELFKQSNIIGYSYIKFDYLDSSYLKTILNKLPLNNNLYNYNIINNVSQIDSQQINPQQQINRKTPLFQKIIKNTKFGFYPSSIYIIKKNIIDQYSPIIDFYTYLEDSNTYDYNIQSFTNALNKYINLLYL